MLGAIIGDIVGSVYEKSGKKDDKFPFFKPSCRFTDDTVMTIAVAEALMYQKPFDKTIKAYGLQYPNRGYGGMFSKWLQSDSLAPYNSFGNGAAMRVSPVGFAYKEEEQVLDVAQQTAEVTHNHPEGIKGAQAVALAVWMARNGKSKEQIRTAIQEKFDYDLQRCIKDIRIDYAFDVTCQGSVPESIIAFLDAHNVESAIRLAVSLGGDADTMAAIAGAIAQAYYRRIPHSIVEQAKRYLPPPFWELTVAFSQKYKAHF
ncbi:MAG: ADP-ribosylglycohydrolase family protein [Thermonemataceae bacterium]